MRLQNSLLLTIGANVGPYSQGVESNNVGEGEAKDAIDIPLESGCQGDSSTSFPLLQIQNTFQRTPEKSKAFPSPNCARALERRGAMLRKSNLVYNPQTLNGRRRIEQTSEFVRAVVVSDGVICFDPIFADGR